MSEAALDLMAALVLENGKHWWSVAGDFQKDDARAILTGEGENWHFITRPRGGSKSTDIGGVSLSWLVADAPPLANGHIVAASTDQASIVIDAIHGLVARTPELDGVVTVEAKRILAANGAWVEVLAQSDSGSWGLRDAHLLICDEFCQWPETRGAQRVWRAIQSAAPKVPGCKLIILSTAGEPSHWSAEVMEKCKIDHLWRVSETPGPVPWQSPEELESLRFHLRPSEYDRLVLNIWSQDEERAVSEDDWNAAVRDYLEKPIVPGIRYVMLVDIGIVNDRTVVTIMHKEPIDPRTPLGPQKVVVDKIKIWRGTKKAPVQLQSVEDYIADESPRWNRAAVHADPTQFRGSIQNLNMRGVYAKEFNFTATSVGEVAAALVQTFRARQIEVPDDLVLKDELLRVRLRETSPGVTRLDHERGAHDDQAVTIGMGCRILLGNGTGLGASWMEHMKRIQAKREENPEAPALAAPPPQMNENPLTTRSVAHGRRCKHRFFAGRCAHCNLTPDAAAKLATGQVTLEEAIALSETVHV